MQPSCFEYADGSLTLILQEEHRIILICGILEIQPYPSTLTTGNYSGDLRLLRVLFCTRYFLDEPPELQISFDVDSLAVVHLLWSSQTPRMQRRIVSGTLEMETPLVDVRML